MTIRIIGAMLVIAGCGGIGFSMAFSHLRAESALVQLLRLTEFLSEELRCRLTPLPQACYLCARQGKGPVGAVFSQLARELEQQLQPDATSCMAAVLERQPSLPEAVKRNLVLMGQSLGRFDLSGQLSGLASVRQIAQRDLDGLRCDQDSRLRSYRTLGLCAGAALAILLI